MIAALPHEVTLESSRCPLACAADDEIVLTSCDRINKLPGEFQMVRCVRCGLIRTDPRPTKETIGFYYPDSYGPYKSTQVNLAAARDSARSAARNLLKRWLDRYVKLHVNSIPPLTPGHMLEIGCGSGLFLHQMSHKGWTVEGIEFSQSAASSAREAGYNVRTSSLEQATGPEDSYDLIVGWMVLEHFHDPVTVLRKLNSWTKPGGWLVVSVPNAASLGFRIFKENWFHLHLPNHLYHYTSQTLSKLFNASGWKLDRVLYQRDLAEWPVSLGYTLEDHQWFSSAARKLIEFPSWQGKLYLALYPFSYVLGISRLAGAMTVWARREDD